MTHLPFEALVAFLTGDPSHWFPGGPSGLDRDPDYQNPDPAPFQIQAEIAEDPEVLVSELLGTAEPDQCMFHPNPKEKKKEKGKKIKNENKNKKEYKYMSLPAIRQRR